MERDGMEGWRDRGIEGWRYGGMEGWRDGGMDESGCTPTWSVERLRDLFPETGMASLMPCPF